MGLTDYKSRTQLYSGGVGGGDSFNSGDLLPENDNANGFIKAFVVSPLNSLLSRSTWLKTLFYQTHKSFMHKTEERATAAEVGVTGTGIEPTAIHYTTVEQLPEVGVLPNDFTLPIVGGDDATSANFPFLQLTTDTTDRKNKKFDVNLTDQAVKFILARTQPTAPASSLPLLYCHASNVNNLGVNIGDGSVNNPYGTIDALLARLDANPTYVNYTIILLGGTFTTDKNIYRACSFYGFPGVIINYTGNKYLLSQFTDVVDSTTIDPNANRRYDVNWYFTGDITVNITGSGGFSKLGYFNTFTTGNEQIGQVRPAMYWFFDFSALNVTGTAYPTVITYKYSIFPLYGAGNQYSVKIKNVYLLSIGISFFEARKSNMDYEDYTNAGVNLTFEFDRVSLFQNGQLLVTGSDNYDFFGRTLIIKGNTIAIGSTASASSTTDVNAQVSGTRLFIGKLQGARNTNVKFLVNSIEFGTGYGVSAETILFGKRGSDLSTTFSVRFLFVNTVFRYNASGSFGWGTENIKICFPDNDSSSKANVIFQNCLKAGISFSTKISGVERGHTPSGLYLDYDLPDSIVDTIGGGTSTAEGSAITEVTKTSITNFKAKVETVSSLWTTNINI